MTRVSGLAAALTFMVLGNDGALAFAPTRHELRCGQATFAIRTTSRDVYRLTQVLTVKTSDGARRRVDLDEHSFVLHREYPGLRVLAAIVSAWSCRQTPIGPVLELLLSCPMDYADDQPDGDCSATREWSGHVSTRGIRLDPGYAPDDPRYDALERRLGIPPNQDDEPLIDAD